MSTEESNSSSNRLPERLFAAGEEPTGERVNSYHKPKNIEYILSSLTPEEVEFIKNSKFQKLIATSEKPSFSGSFGQYIITRMLKVSKKHEIWFIFAGKPIRMSLREFAIVTGLPCGKYPKRPKKKTNLVKQKPYWPELFGLLPSMSVENALGMLKRKKIVDKDIKMKYALLALTSSVLCPSSHKPKIIKEHAELIRDIDEFFLYPWGRLAFEKLISSIKSKDVVALSQSTVALKGFVLALQLVMVEAVPELTEVVQIDEAASDSDSESGKEGDEVTGGEDESEKSFTATTTVAAPNLSLSPAHAREVDEACKATVHSIISDDPVMELDESDFLWSDEEEDEEVDNMVKLISEGHLFRKEMFTGGLTAAELEIIRSERNDAKEKRDKEKTPDADPRPVVNADHAASVANPGDNLAAAQMLVDKLGEAIRASDDKLSRVEDKVNHIAEESAKTEEMIEKAIDRKMATMQQAIVDAITTYLQKEITVSAEEEPRPHSPSRQSQVTWYSRQKKKDNEIIDGVVEDISNAMLTEDNDTDAPQFNKTTTNQASPNPPVGYDTVVVKPSAVVQENPPRKSTRSRAQPSLLVDYEVGAKKRKLGKEPTFNLLGHDPTVDYGAKLSVLRGRLTPSRIISIGDGTCVTGEDVAAIADRSTFLPTKVMDALMQYTAALFESICPRPNDSRVDFFDTKFASILHKHHSKFNRTHVKDKRKFQWSDVIVDYFGLEDEQPPMWQRIYFPFNVDKTHWVGVCVDAVAAKIEVLDCNMSKRTGNAMKLDLTPLAQMLPYILNRNHESSLEEKPFPIARAKGIPQTANPNDSGLMSVLLIHAHSIAGIDVCKRIMPEDLSVEGVKLAVLFYERYAEAV